MPPRRRAHAAVMGMPVAPVVPIHQPPLVDDDFTREFRRGIDRVAEAMEGLGDDETLQALLHQLRTLERRPLAKVGFALSVALYLFASAIAVLSLATIYTTTRVWSLTIGTRSAVVLRSALVAGLLFVSAYVSGAPIAFLCGVLVGLLYATLN